jgi:hypothetical protein
MQDLPTTTVTSEHSGEVGQNKGCLGKLAPKNDPRQLMFAKFEGGKLKTVDAAPLVSDFWKSRAKFPAHSYGNTNIGDCTRASQAAFATRMERIEQKRTIEISEAEVERVYYAMTEKLYGGGDTGAYEIDALNCWRRPEETFKDGKGNPLTIDAYVRVNHMDQMEIRRAINFSGGHGVKLCFALPRAWASVDITEPWDGPPENTPMNGDWEPYSWGGHSMTAVAYNKVGIRVQHTWFDGPKGTPSEQIVTWRGMAYCDEMYVVIDSVDAWRKRADILKFDLTNLVKAVNTVSSKQIGE